MKIHGQAMRTIWPDADQTSIHVIDQIKLPHLFETKHLRTSAEAADSILTMVVRGAPLIGATAAYGYAFAMREDPSDANLDTAYQRLYETRPTAVNLRWALDDLRQRLKPLAPSERFTAAWQRAGQICDEDVEICRKIGEAGLALIRTAQKPNKTVNILTHCNAGWLACVEGAVAGRVVLRRLAWPCVMVLVALGPRRTAVALAAFSMPML